MKPLKTMSWLFFSHDLGLLIGTLVGGFLAVSMDTNFVISACLVSNAMCITFIPTLHDFGTMIFLVLSYGLSLGIPDCLTNVMLVKIFGKEVAPFLQGVHFFYGFGAFISPLVARPFLRPGCTFRLNTTHYVFNATHNTTFNNTSGPWLYNTVEEVADASSDICFAYWVISVSHIPVIFGISWLYFRKAMEKKKGTYTGSITNLHEEIDIRDAEGTSQTPTLDMILYDPEATVLEKIRKNERTRLMTVTALCSVLIYLYEGMMAMFGGYAYTYAVKGDVAMTSDQAAYLTSFYWGCFSLGRFICIPIAFFLASKTMLSGNVIGCFISSFILIAGHANFYAVWIGSCGLGFFLSSTGPTIISIAKEYVDLTTHSTSILVVMAALGELTMPVIVGQIFERVGAGVVPVTVFLICLLGFVVFCFLLTLDNEVAYEHANSFLQVMLRSFLTCRPNRYQGYTSMESTSDVSSSSESLSLISQEECIPKPTVLTDVVQPED